MTTQTDQTIMMISSGALDGDLEKIRKMIDDRLTSVRNARTSSEFSIGDRVKINDYCGTKYIRGQYATVVSKARTKITILLDNPIGRFSEIGPGGVVVGAHVKVPPAILDRVE